MNNSNRKHARPRYQRQFLRWLEENSHRFEIPIRIKKRHCAYIELELFCTDPPSLMPVVVNRDGISVSVTLNEEFFDTLIEFDVLPKHGPNGYYDGFCQPEYYTYYPDLPSLWSAEVFEPFIERVNTRLALARWIRLCRIDEGFRTSQLIFEEDELNRQPTNEIDLLCGLVPISGDISFDPENAKIVFWTYPTARLKDFSQ